jgi:hypothetical protein
MAHTGGSVAVAVQGTAADISYSRLLRYRAEYDAAHADAVLAAAEYLSCLAGGAGIRAVAQAARKEQLASARLYTSAACLISPP